MPWVAWVTWEAGIPLATSCESPGSHGLSELLLSSIAVTMQEKVMLKAHSFRLWGWALGTRLYQGMPRLPAWGCLP